MVKRRSKIIKDLIMDNISVLQAMKSLDFMLEDMDNKEIKDWVTNELNGYQKDDELPKYRNTRALLIGNVQVGYAIYNQVNIPLSDSKAIEMLTKIEIREPISTIMQMAKAENESEDHYLTLDANLILVNQYQQTNGDVIRAHRKLSLYTYNNILAMIKDKLLEIFKVLEENYGNLDELYIDFSDDLKKDVIIKEIGSIVYNDHSINMSSNNQIKESKIGDNNGN